ncbi:MAG: HAMP domain-containing protein [Cyanobacteria bacterium]|nr:HAMP domain-containing protein [Cyanobacteriota bacterium]
MVRTKFLRSRPSRDVIVQPLRQFKRRSLSLKLTILITSLVMTIVGATTLLSIQREQRNFRTELKQQAALLSDSLAITLRDPLYRLDASLLRDFVATLGQYDQVFSAAYLYDSQGRLLVDANQAGPIYAIESDPLGQRLINSSGPQFEWREDELVISRAIAIGGQPVGAIRLGLSTEPLQQKVAAVRNWGIGVAAISTILSALLARWISRSIPQPVQELVRGTQQLSQGNFEQPIQIQTGDELSVLADAFNTMGRQLQQTLSLLAQQNEDLEIRVEQRTETLSQTLKDLQDAQAQLIQSEKMSGFGQMWLALPMRSITR